MAASSRISRVRRSAFCLRLVLSSIGLTTNVLLLTSVACPPAVAVRLPVASCEGKAAHGCDSEGAMLACVSRDAREDGLSMFAAAYPACYCTLGLPRHCSNVCDRSDDLSECTVLCPDYAKACRAGWTFPSPPGRAALTAILIALMIMAVVGVMVVYGAVQYCRSAKGDGKESIHSNDKKMAGNVEKPSLDVNHALMKAPECHFKTPF